MKHFNKKSDKVYKEIYDALSKISMNTIAGYKPHKALIYFQEDYFVIKDIVDMSEFQFVMKHYT